MDSDVKVLVIVMVMGSKLMVMVMSTMVSTSQDSGSDLGRELEKDTKGIMGVQIVRTRNHNIPDVS